MFEVNNKHTRTTSVNFEHVIAGWNHYAARPGETKHELYFNLKPTRLFVFLNTIEIPPVQEMPVHILRYLLSFLEAH